MSRSSHPCLNCGDDRSGEANSKDKAVPEPARPLKTGSHSRPRRSQASTQNAGAHVGKQCPSAVTAGCRSKRQQPRTTRSGRCSGRTKSSPSLADARHPSCNGSNERVAALGSRFAGLSTAERPERRSRYLASNAGIADLSDSDTDTQELVAGDAVARELLARLRAVRERRQQHARRMAELRRQLAHVERHLARMQAEGHAAAGPAHQ